jgi:hypothetical protein
MSEEVLCENARILCACITHLPIHIEAHQLTGWRFTELIMLKIWMETGGYR